MSGTIRRIDRVIRRKNQQIQRLRDLRNRLCVTCPHENLVGEFHADTGNWCKQQDDDYWIQAECVDCGHKFRVSKNEEPERYREVSLLIRERRERQAADATTCS